MAHCSDCGSRIEELVVEGDLVPNSQYKAFTCPDCGAVLGAGMTD